MALKSPDQLEQARAFIAEHTQQTPAGAALTNEHKSGDIHQ
jgi:[acyl-carrier-protein] S-malonyltransferase